ncbi:proline--tRNA ligase ProS [Gottschalkia acidurici 9a]|uniref:Proline--tRNA ligase n=1 Tax=Gottschalkia acidurici (strain ATCC 7906 / DSM 604 / BCRC 14475 / CIP 104303 / KCTC 5404 / NCIMB 10678 / 9a) TaxID=1128398 RepID=K0AZR7_GOTA9|nr:proline--tRNA ligase [Gottschalkia acidurici]AFS79293.1 proline--tRNA ligase ProS [Gottschalkia acidurici 9a]
MRMSKLYLQTLREVPAEAELPSHKLLLRSGMIKRLVSGVYTYLPLGYKVIKKIENIVREEMDAIDSQEVHMSAIQPAELWQESGRWDAFGPEMFRLRDRHNREFCLGPTHEEIFTDMIRFDIKSYKQLPLSLYQIQTKYRDEKRPRFGLMRCREFIMKDAYTFDLDPEGMRKSYFDMWKAYEKIFDRCGINYKVVEGDSGAMGGSDSHEFMATSEFGESAMAYCNDCDYAATDEKAKFIYEVNSQDENELNVEKIHTPNARTIDELKELFNTTGDKFVKTLLYSANDKVVAVLVPGDRELNEIKLINTLGVLEHDLFMADEETVKKVTGAEVGFAGPINLKGDVRILVDSRVANMKNFIVGANETDYHLKNVNYGKDFAGEIVDDLLLVKEGDKCPNCRSPLNMDRGIEIGNIFQLGTKYTDALNATYLDENGKAAQIWMGSHGVGVSRTMAAIIEQNYDENGIIWPLSVAPYQVLVTIVNIKDAEQVALGEKLYEELSNLGIEVLLDDRNERAGVKFKDADLIGTPIRVTVGKKASENILEFSLRKDGNKEEVNVSEVMNKIKEEFTNQGLRI